MLASLSEKYRHKIKTADELGKIIGPRPREKRGGHASDSQGLIPAVLATVRPGDVVLVKGSLGTRMAPIVAALLALEEADRPARRANGK